MAQNFRTKLPIVEAKIPQKNDTKKLRLEADNVPFLFDHFLDDRVEIMELFFWKIENSTISFWNFLTFMWATTKWSIKSPTTSSLIKIVCTFIFRISTIFVNNHCWGHLQNRNKSPFKCLLTDLSDQIMNFQILFSPIFSLIYISWKRNRLSVWSKNQTNIV